VATRIEGVNEPGGVAAVESRQCLTGIGFSFDVEDRYAFDLDETVQVEVTFYLQDQAVPVEVKYERNGGAETTKEAQIPAYRSGSRFYKHSFTLDRARLANRSLFNTDFSVGAVADARKLYANRELAAPTVTICDVEFKRSHTTPARQDVGKITLKVVDEKGRLVPARIGIYDATGWLPYPSDEAVEVKRLDETMRVVNVTPGLIPWPASNPSAFYIDGSYSASLPAGPYELVVAKGPEYRIVRHTFDVKKDKAEAIRITLERWDDLPAKGWYSGDNHIHYIRHSEKDDPNLLLFTQAEDLHVGNIVQMGNIARAHWPQYGWEPVIEKADDTYAFVPGQEDPRTSRVGHTLSLNLREPIRDPQHYLIYRPIFEAAKEQGGVTGYAHAHYPTVVRGTALDVPLGLVDFFEVMQVGLTGTERWFDFLNLGYKLAPSAGTDYMWDFTLPGAERSYVHVEKPFTLQGWFDGLKRGKTFVTNGPMLEFTLNGQPMGSELKLKSGDRVVIEASASINPDIDYLGSLELIEQGDVIKTVKAERDNETGLTLRHETTAQHGSWFVVRAIGKLPRTDRVEIFGEGPAKTALSGAIYVHVDGRSFWKPSEVPAIVDRLEKDMEQMMAPEDGRGGAEPWDTPELTLQTWEAQKPLLKQRIDEVMPIYDDLVKRAKAELKAR
jgi:hypothetical protein